MKDVAREAGVSKALVSIIFRQAPGASAATREQVFAAAERLGYQLDTRASRLSRLHTRTLGVVFEFGGDFHASMIDALYAVSQTSGFELVLHAVTGRRGESAAIKAALAERCEGLILLGPRLPTRELATLTSSTPTVLLLRDLPRTAGVDVVRTDEGDALDQLIGHLTELGHERIVHVDGGAAANAAQRRRAYRAAMAKRSLRPEVVDGGLTEADGARAVRRLLRGGPTPTALVAFNDRCAIGALQKLCTLGVAVPRQLSVTGFDDIPAAGYPHISLTTIRQNTDELARQAIGRLRARLEDREPPAKAILPNAQLVARATTSVASID